MPGRCDKLSSVVSAATRATGSCAMRSSVRPMCGTRIPSVMAGLSKKRYAAFEARFGQRLRKGALRTLDQPTGQLDQPTASPRVAQVGCAEFLHRPIGIRVS